jgi:nitrite reductase (NO-forming)
MYRETFTKLGATNVDRRSFLKKAGVLGLSLPAAGMLLNACGSNDNVDPRITNAQSASANRQAASEPAAAQAAPISELTIVAKDIFFEPDMLEVPAGSLVRLTFINEGVMEHDWEVPDLTASDFTVVSSPEGMTARMSDLLAENEAAGIPYAGGGAGDEMVIEFTAEQPGSYEMLCVVPGHKEAGMVGTFKVVGDGSAEGDSDYHDPHVAPASETSTGTPYDAPQLDNPAVAPPVGARREPQLIKETIEIKEVVGYVDDGVAFDFWTFGGTIPGPMVRVRVGDTVELTLKNPAESKATHNIDFHSATGPGGGAKATTIAPGQSATIRFKAMNPGVFVYHCAVAPIPHHISAGMYGLMVVEPEEGLPPVDKEFYVMQGDLYLEGARGEKGLRGFSMDKMLDERPDYVTLNGSVGAIAGDRAFKADVGDTVRIFFGVGGPSLVSSFHVIGEIFDRVMVEGATEWSTNIQTTLVPAGGATIVDFKVEVPGTLMMVDHSLGRLHKGCVGMIEVEGDENPDVFEIVSPAG